MNGGFKVTGEREDCGNALLSCEGYPSCGPWVEHEFVKLERVGEGDTLADEHVYRCCRCGHLRRWGLDSVVNSRPRRPGTGPGSAIREVARSVANDVTSRSEVTR